MSHKQDIGFENTQRSRTSTSFMPAVMADAAVSNAKRELDTQLPTREVSPATAQRQVPPPSPQRQVPPPTPQRQVPPPTPQRQVPPQTANS